MRTYATNLDQIVADLRRIVEALEVLGPLPLSETAVSFDLQVSSHGVPEGGRVDLVADLCRRFLGVEPTSRDASNLYGTPVMGVDIGCINVDLFTAVAPGRERELAAEVEALRAQLAESQADHTGGPIPGCECEDCAELAEAS